MTGVTGSQAEWVVQTLPTDEAVGLVRRVAGHRGIPWDRSAVKGVGGFSLNMAGNPEQERVVWATVGKDRGLLGLFVGERLAAVGNEGLAEVLRVQPLDLPGLPHLALMVEDRADEMVGAFTLEERSRIYVWDGRHLRMVIVVPLLQEQFIHPRWQNPHGANIWRYYRTTGKQSLHDGLLVVSLHHEESEALGKPNEPIPERKAFRVRSERNEILRYRWNARLRRFEPVTG